jgi:hypothetical protein
MKIAALPTKLLMILLGILTTVFAGAPLLNAQSTQTPPEGSTAAVSADSTYLARANATLLKGRQLVDEFFYASTNAVCKENVSQMMVGKNNKPFYREDSVFEYQLQTNNRSGSLRLVENRETRKAAFQDPYKSLLITNGFANMLLVLHQNYEASYIFEPAAEEQMEGRSLFKFHFKAVPGASSPAAIQLSGRNYPLQMHGDIWIDEGSGAVIKLFTSLDGGLEDLGLRDLRSEVHYSYVQFHDPEEAYWLPASAVIDLETPKQHWRNVHRFSDYRRFRVNVKVELGENKP